MSYDGAVASILPNAPLRWKFDEASGTTAINSGTAGSAGNMTASAPGMTGQPALITTGSSWRFNDTIGSATWASSATAGGIINGWNALAAVLWVKYDAANGTGNDFIIDSTDGTIAGGLSIRKASGTGYISGNLQYTGGRTLFNTPSASLSANAPHCVIVTWASGQNIKVYIDGVSQELGFSQGPLNPAGTLVNPSDLYLGRWKNQLDTNLGGWLDDVTLAPKYISDAEALQLFQEGTMRIGTGAVSVASATPSTGVKVGLSSVFLGANGAMAVAGLKQAVGGVGDSSNAISDASGSKTTVSAVTLAATTGAVADGDRSLPPGLLMELNVQRQLTEAFINTMPVDITLIPRTRVSDGMGGYTWSEQSPRTPQTMRLIEYSNEATVPEPVLASDGHQRYVQYELLAKWDAELGIWDHFEYDGDEWEVVEVYFNNGWERRAKVARFGNGGQP